MADNNIELNVAGTSWRPSFLPFFVLSRNNLNPKVTLSEHGVQVKILKNNALPWSSIQSAVVKKGIRCHYCELQTSQDGTYLVYVRAAESLHPLLGALTHHSIPFDTPPNFPGS